MSDTVEQATTLEDIEATTKLNVIKDVNKIIDASIITVDEAHRRLGWNRPNV